MATEIILKSQKTYFGTISLIKIHTSIGYQPSF
jgi:hypothetical protein